MKQLEPKHWMVIGAILVSLGTSISGLEHGWRDALTPQFIGGQMLFVGTTLTAMFVGAPKDKV